MTFPSPDSLQENPQNPHIRSFVRRAGRVSDAQQRYFETMMPAIGIAYQQRAIDLNACFGRQAEKILEIGFGMGDATTKIAEIFPEKDFLGLEVHLPGIGALCKQIAEKNLTNLRICPHDAVEVLQDMVLPESLDGIHIFFPDPWHKKRHHKRRLIQSPFVALMASRLKKGAYVHCATDWEEYAVQMLSVFSAETQLQNTAENYAPRPAYRPPTKFENRGLRLGHGVWDVVFRKKQ